MSKATMGYGARLIVDNHHGVYSAMEACRIARELGWDGRQPTDIEDSWYQEQVATDWLNENVATDNHSFGWWEGGYFYMPQTWWEDVA